MGAVYARYDPRARRVRARALARPTVADYLAAGTAHAEPLREATQTLSSAESESQRTARPR